MISCEAPTVSSAAYHVRIGSALSQPYQVSISYLTRDLRRRIDALYISQSGMDIAQRGMNKRMEI